VAEYEGNVLGLINSAATSKVDLADESLKDMIGHDAEGKNTVIFSVAVQPDLQGHGIAGLLMNAYIERMQDLEKERIFLICKKDLIGFYEKFDFVYIARSRSNHGGASWHEMGLALKQRIVKALKAALQKNHCPCRPPR